ncbi:MAG: sigma-54-dependent Fis family transcriptional regulator [Nitrospiraceae bacterium]|nr:MAG: sigma-54-dependent Fis family transcriptional regulator [Nitrospiraceae bacterium]
MINTSLPILLVDDEPKILFSYSLILKSVSIKNIITIEDSRKVIPLLEKKQVALIVLDLIMPHISGAELLSRVKSEFPHIPVIVMTATNEIEKAVDCMKAGATDYLVKPVEENRFISSIQKAIEMGSLQNEIISLKKHLLSGKLENEKAFAPIITRSKSMQSIFHYVEAVAKSKKPVFITGETGVGKELIARSVYKASGLEGEHIAVNVAGLDDTMFSDTLFGHRKGAFTGADRDREGLIVKAADGTLLLDEIGDLSMSSQVKLLRLLEEQVYYPLGSDLPEKSNARIIACSNHDIEKQIQDGQFRKDLYYRLCAHHVHIPPLRERLEDIPLLLDHFLTDASSSLHKPKPEVPAELIPILSAYQFPGNIREMQAMVHDAVAQCTDGKLSIDNFKGLKKHKGPLSINSNINTERGDVSLSEVFGRFPTLKEIEEHVIKEALHIANDKQGPAAALLGISRQALNQRLKKKKKS